jgi:hypothetical protein
VTVRFNPSVRVTDGLAVAGERVLAVGWVGMGVGDEVWAAPHAASRGTIKRVIRCFRNITFSWIIF